MPWTFNRDYHDLDQVAEFYPAYLKILAELTAAGLYPYNDSFKGRIPGIEGPCEDTAIYLLQSTRSVRETEATVVAHREAGWRDLKPGELDNGPIRYAGIAEYGFYMGGTGWQTWADSRLTKWNSSIAVLPGRARTNGLLVNGSLLVQDRT
jgi:hypothetical protein